MVLGYNNNSFGRVAVTYGGHSIIISMEAIKRRIT